MTPFILRRVELDIPADSTRFRTFRNARVLNRIVFVFNRGPGRISVTRSVSANGVNFTALPGTRIILPGRMALIRLPSFAVFTRLNITAINRRAVVDLLWFERLLEHSKK